MRISVFLFIFLLISCGSYLDNPARPQSADRQSDSQSETKSAEIYAETSINNFALRLVNRDGRCVLLYHRSDLDNQAADDSQDLGMIAPCNFVRAEWKGFEPEYYLYRKGSSRRAVLLVTGGRPDPTIKDQFLPQGCGTTLSKIYVLPDRMKFLWASENGPPICPSRGMEEKNFAS